MRAIRGSARDDQGTVGRSTALAAAWWLAMFAAWIALVDSVALPELLVGLTAATVAALVAYEVHRRGYISFRPRFRWLLQSPRLVRSVLADSATLGYALWRRVVRREPVHGTTIRIPFDYGGDNGRDGARRALVNLSVSLTPNSYVIDIDPEGHSLLVHQLVARPLDPVLDRQRRRAHDRGIGDGA